MQAYYRENGLVKESDIVKEVAEDTKSIVSVYASVGDESKTVFKVEGLLGKVIGKDYWEGLLGKVNNESEKVVISQAGEALTNGHGGSEVENFDIDVNGQVALSKELCCTNSFAMQIFVLCK